METPTTKNRCETSSTIQMLPGDNPLDGLLSQLEDSLGRAVEITRFLSKCVIAAKNRQHCANYTNDGENVTDSPMVQMLFAKSKYAIDPGEMTARRRRDLDTNGTIAIQFTSSIERRVDESTNECVNETFVLHATPNLKESVAAFDTAVGSFRIIRFMEKNDMSRAAACGGNKGKCLHPCAEQGKNSGKCPHSAKADLSEKARKAIEKARSLVGVPFGSMPPPISQFKRFLLDKSGYRIPAKRFKVVADRVDRKSQKYVYELRFFQKDYTKTPADTQSYERATFRLPMKGFDEKKVAARFDKAVEDLKFNTFARKA